MGLKEYGFAIAICGCLLLRGRVGSAQEALPPPGQFVTVTSPVDDVVYHRVSTAALKLQAEAIAAQRKAILVIQINPGASPFHQVQGLAKFLSSPQVSQVTTVAWIPENVTGVHVLLALACRELVVPETVSFGDVSRGGTLEPEEEQFALALAQKRLNPKVSSAIVRALIDPRQTLHRARVRTAAGPVETRLLTGDELEELRQSNVPIEDVETIKEGGTPGVFTGKTARSWDILVTHLVENKSAVLDVYGLPRDAMREPVDARRSDQVRMIRIHGNIDAMLESFLARQIHQAEADGVEVLILELESPAGQLLASINLAFVIAEVNPERMRTVAYISDRAYSGSAVVAMACDDVYLTPAARWGSASPAHPREAKQFERSPDKLAQLKAALANLAKKKGRPAALAVAMADRATIVRQTTHAENGRIWFHTPEELHASRGEWLEGPVLPEADGSQILIVSGQRAAELKLAAPPVESLDELKSRLQIPPGTRIGRAEPTWVDQLVFFLNRPSVTVLLLVLAVSFLYVEMHFNTTILGLLSLLCFALFFWSKFLGGTADWLEVILFVLGLGCLAAEVFLVPGFGVFGVSGILLVLSSLVMASQTFGNLEPNADWDQLAKSFGTVFASLIGMGIVGIGLGRLLPHTPLYDSMVLSPPGTETLDEPKLRPKSNAGPHGLAPLGTRGTALSVLRPSGKAEFEGRVVDVVSDGPFIPAGSHIEVVVASRTRIVVRQVT